MENKNFSFDLAHQKLLPAHISEHCRECDNGRVDKKYSNLAMVIKVVVVLTVLSACFTAILCAVYCNSALKDIRHMHTEITELKNAKDVTSDYSEINKGKVTEATPKFERLLSQPKTENTGKKQNNGLFVDDTSTDPDKGLDQQNEYENMGDDSNDVVNDLFDDSDDYDYDSDGYNYEESDNYDDEDEYEDVYNDETDDEKLFDDEGFFDDESYDEEYDSKYNYDNAVESDKIDEDVFSINDMLDLDEEYGESSGNLIDDEDQHRVRRDTEKQKKEKKEKRRKNKDKKEKKRKRKDKQKKLKSLPAAQFHANITEEKLMKLGVGYDAYKLTDECAYSSEMNGIYCRNKTFTPNTRQPLRIFKKESWVDDKKSPVTMKGKKFVVKNNGTHLVYGQITMKGKVQPVSASITRERHGVEPQYLTCTNDCIPDTCTCSIFGLMNLKAGDTLHVQTNNGFNDIMFEEAATYMGVVQLNRD